MASSTLTVRIVAIDKASAALKSIQSGIIRLVGAVAALGAAFKVITFPAQEAAKFEREMVNVAKTTGFTEDQIDGLSTTMIDLSKTMSVTATDLAAIAAIAGQLGLGSFGVEAIEVFTESVAKASVTLGLTTQKAAEFGAQISTIFNLDPTNIEKVFATLNALSNTSVATAGQIADIVKRIGSVGGVTLQQSSALAAFFRDMGVQVEVAGTSTVKVFSNMSAKASEFAEVAGISTQKWIELMEQDAVGALTTVTSKLYEMDRASRDATAKELFGGGRILSTYTKLIDSAADGYTRLNGHLQTANTSFIEGTSSLEEYDKVMDSLSEQFKVLTSSLRAMAIEMGENLTPVIREMVQDFNKFLNSDAGRDFFFQLAEGIKAFIVGIGNSISYLSQWGTEWSNILSILKNILIVMVAMSVARFVIGAVTAVKSLGAALGLANLAALGFSGSIASLGPIIAGLAVPFLGLVAAIAAVTGVFYIFEEEIRSFLGLKTQAEIDLDIQVRADTRKAKEQMDKAVLTVSDLSKKVLESSKINLEIPISTTVTLDKEKLAKQLQDEMAQSSKLVDATQVIESQLTDQIESISLSLDINEIINIPTVVDTSVFGDIDTLSNKLVDLREKIAYVKQAQQDAQGTPTEWLSVYGERLSELSAAYEETSRKLGNELGVNISTASLTDLKELRTNLLALDSVGKANISNEFIDSLDLIISKTKKLEENTKTAALAYRQLDRAVDTAETIAGEASLNAVISATQDKRKAEAELELLRATKVSNSQDELAALNAQIKKVEILNDKIAAGIKKSQTGRGGSSNVDLLAEAEKELNRLAGKYSEAETAYAAYKAKEVTIAKTSADAVTAVNEEISKSSDVNYQTSLKNISDLSAAQLQYAEIRASSNNITADNSGSADQINEGTIANLDEMIKKRAIINKQIQDFDDYSQDALDTAERFDGAYDNIEKTLRSMRKSMESFGSSLDEIIRKRGAAGAAKEFDLGIDKDLKLELRKINKEYDKLIEAAQEPSTGTGQFSVFGAKSIEDEVQALKDLRDEATDAAKEKARLAKVDVDRKVAISDVTRTLADQKDEQAKLNDLIKKFKADQASGGYEGVDGIRKYNEAMIELEEQTKRVGESSTSARGSLKDLAKIEGTPDSTIDNYRKSLEELDKAGVSLRADQIELGKVLGDSVNALASTERGKMVEPYQALNTEIGALSKRIPGLAKYIKTMTAEADASASTMDTLGGSVAEASAQIQNMTKNNIGFGNLLAGSDEYVESLRQASDLIRGFAATTKPVTIGIQVDPNAATDFQSQLDVALGGDKTVDATLAVTQVVDKDGNKTLNVQNVGIEPDPALLNEGIQVAIKGQKFIIPIDDKALQDEITAALAKGLGAATSEIQITTVGEVHGIEIPKATIRAEDIIVEGDTQPLPVDMTATDVKVVDDINAEFKAKGDKVDITSPVEVELKATKITGVNAAINAATNAYGGYIDKDATGNYIQRNATGGHIQSNAGGGSIRGAGTSMSDSILSWLSNGEYVIRASMVSKFGKGFFDMLNMGMLPAFAGGGLSGAAPSSTGSSVATPTPEDLGNVTLNVGDKAYTLYGERKQTKEFVNTLKKMSRG